MQGKTHRRSARSRLCVTSRAKGLRDQTGLEAGSARTGVLPPHQPPGVLRRHDPHDQSLASAGLKLSATAPGKPVEPTHRGAAKSVLDALTRSDLTAYAELAIELR